MAVGILPIGGEQEGCAYRKILEPNVTYPRWWALNSLTVGLLKPDRTRVLAS